MHDAQHSSRMLPFVLRNEMIAFYIRQPKANPRNAIPTTSFAVHTWRPVACNVEAKVWRRAKDAYQND
jgi:hypothetical protein